MSTVRDIPDPIDWHEGMLLAPQHFQQEALRASTALSVRLDQVAAFPWGITHLVLDRVALVSGMVRVLELEGVMPDGLTVWHDNTSPEPLELDIGPMGDPLAQAPITIFITVPAARSGSWGGSQRWRSSEGKPVADENSGEEIPVPRLRPRLALTAIPTPGDMPPQRLVSLPIARVTFANDSFALVENYAPPALAVPANSPIGRLCADIARRAREKAMLLAERIVDGGVASPGSGDVNGEIRALVVSLPVLEAQLAVECVHPFLLYQSMCALLGHVSYLSTGKVPPKLSRYDHYDPYAAFSEIQDYIVRMVDRVREAVEPIRFRFESGMFGLEMTKDWIAGRLFIGVRGPAAMSAAEIVAWIENAVIASRSQLERLATLRVKGLARTVVETDSEIGLVVPRGTVLFRIEKDEELLLAGEPLEVWNPDNLGSRSRPVDISLYVAP